MARKHRPEFTFGSGSFLDVLCNMVGILIILIAVVGMRVADPDDPEISPVAEEPQHVATVEPVVDPSIEARRLAAEERKKEIAVALANQRQAVLEHEQNLRTRQAAWQQMLAEMRARNAEIARQAEELQQRLQAETASLDAEEDKRLKLAGMIAAAAGQNAALRQSETDLQRQALELMQQRKQIQAQIEIQKVSHAIQKPVFEIETRDGNSGTHRRPILIECRADGLEFASEKVNLTPQDLNHFAPDYNPLLAGAEALMTYWTLVDQQKGETASKPYVLLIVRPGGTIGFYVARKYLEVLNQDYGYELVQDGTEIKWPAADPQAAEICRNAVDEVLKGPRSTVARRFANGLGRRGGESRFDGRTGSGSETGEKIMGANGKFELPEVEELRRSSPRDSIDMLGPEWSPQRQRLSANRAPSAAETRTSENRSFATGDGAAAGDGNDGHQRHPMETLEEQAFGNQASGNQASSNQISSDRSSAGSRSSPASESNAAAAGALRSGFQLKPAGEGQQGAGERQIVPPSPDDPPRSLSGASTDFRDRFRPGARPDMPASPLEKQQSGMPQDGGRDRHWGRGRNAGLIGIEREIVMHLYADRITIANGPSAELPEVMGREGFHELVAAMIQAEANTWGDPPAKFSWRPRLKIQIHPGGNQHYARLKELLQHWGMSSKVEQVLD